MRLFSRKLSPLASLPPAVVTRRHSFVNFDPIPFSENLRAVLEQPVDERTAQIMRDIAEQVATAEAAMASRRIIRFPVSGGIGHLVRDSAGYMTALSGEPPIQAAIS